MTNARWIYRPIATSSSSVDGWRARDCDSSASSRIVGGAGRRFTGAMVAARSSSVTAYAGSRPIARTSLMTAFFTPSILPVASMAGPSRPSPLKNPPSHQGARNFLQGHEQAGPVPPQLRAQRLAWAGAGLELPEPATVIDPGRERRRTRLCVRGLTACSGSIDRCPFVKVPAAILGNRVSPHAKDRPKKWTPTRRRKVAHMNDLRE